MEIGTVFLAREVRNSRWRVCLDRWAVESGVGSLDLET